MILARLWVNFERELPEGMDYRIRLIAYATFLQAVRDTAHCAKALPADQRETFLATLVQEAQGAIDALPEKAP